MTTVASNDIPADDLSRQLTLASPDADKGLRHVSVAGNTYTILVSGQDTGGRYSLIDMHVPPGGGPPLHRHDFEEMFTVLDGEIEVTFRGQKMNAGTGQTLNVPANAPHSFKNTSNKPARLLCLCSPSGQEDFFLEIGDLVESRTAPPPLLSDQVLAKRREKAMSLAPKYRTQMLQP